jgi:hypothetical protein
MSPARLWKRFSAYANRPVRPTGIGLTPERTPTRAQVMAQVEQTHRLLDRLDAQLEELARLVEEQIGLCQRRS